MRVTDIDPAIAKSTLHNGALFPVSVTAVSGASGVSLATPEPVDAASRLQIDLVDISLAISAFVGAIGSVPKFPRPPLSKSRKVIIQGTITP